MAPKSYTFIIASNSRGSFRKFRVPVYVFHGLLALTVIGGVTLLAAVASYSRMLWKAANYDALQSEKTRLAQRYQQLQTEVKDTNQRLTSLQSLATEMAMAYGIARFQATPFSVSSPADAADSYEASLEQFGFLVRNAPFLTAAQRGPQLITGRSLEQASFIPSLWPVMGRLTGSFGERLDPFTGEGDFHAGVDISTDYGAPVRATAEGVVVVVGLRPGYGRLVGIDHGFGITSWYGHLSGLNTDVGARVKRGDVVGFVGVSGRTTGPHVHYEVRMHGAPVNPWRFLRTSTGTD